MDKQLGNLNPQLREVYDRVMNTTVQKPEPVAAKPEPVKNENPLIEEKRETPVISKKDEPQPQPDANPVTKKSDTYMTFNAHNQKPANNVKKSGISLPFIGIAVILFLLIYAFLWIKIFNVKLPFLPF